MGCGRSSGLTGPVTFQDLPVPYGDLTTTTTTTIKLLKKKRKKKKVHYWMSSSTEQHRRGAATPNNGTRLFLSHLYGTTMSSVWRPVNAAANRSDTDLLRPAHRQGVVVIRLLGVVIRAHFVDIESHIVPLFVSSRPARQRTQDHDAVQPHCLLPAALSVSSSQLHVPDGGGG